jgi:Flp pilus assembly protein TadG
MNRPFFTRLRQERGAILIQVAVAMIGLLGFCALVMDYGVFWMSRRQAQDSADAGALAGAIELSFYSPTDFTDGGPAKQAAHAAALANHVFGDPPDNNVTTDITFLGPSFPDPCPDGSSNTCIKVDVYRTVARNNPLPTFFARLFGISAQDVSATATAKILSGTSVTCMRPFAIIDKWDEFDPGHELPHDFDKGVPDPDFDAFTSTYDQYPISGGGPKIPWEDDYYVADTTCDPTDTNCTVTPGTGWRPYGPDGTTPVDYGRRVEIHTGAQDQTSAGYFQPVRLHPGDSGANDYCMNIKECDPSVSNFIGQVISTENGNMVGPTKQCLFTDKDSLKNEDPNAKWNDQTKQIEGSCAPGICPDGNYHAQSPRIVPLPVISPKEYFSTDPNGHTTLVIHNILGFFVEDQIGKGGLTVTRGVLINVPSDDLGGSTTSQTSWIKKIILIR